MVGTVAQGSRIRRRSRRTGVLAVAGFVVILGGCRDSGLPDKNIPLAEAQTRQLPYPAYQTNPASAQLHDELLRAALVVVRPCDVPAPRRIVSHHLHRSGRLVAEPGRLRSLCDQPWIRNVNS